MILFFIAWLIPLMLIMRPLIGGRFPFWFDPARDMLSAWDNLNKPTLIGPPTGIPGFFYGPYWIWLLSIGEIVSKDPRMVVFLTAAIPYFLVFPFIIYSLANLLKERSVATVLWLAFILAFPAYSHQIWNPNLSPLIFLSIIWLSVKLDFRKHLKLFAILGVLTGLLLNFNFSLGTGVLVGETLFILANLTYCYFPKNRSLSLIQTFIKFMLFAGGNAVIFTPFFLFELRHGFNQIKAMVFTLSQAVLHNSVVVGQTGLNKNEVVANFFNRLAAPWHTSLIVYIFILSLMAAYFLIKMKLTSVDKRLLTVLGANGIAIISVLLSSKNPVWNYHFIGVEIIGLLLPAVFLARNRLFRNLSFIWMFVIMGVTLFNFLKPAVTKGYANSDLRPKKDTVVRIYKDAGKNTFGVAALNNAIYTFDYDYLFRWQGSVYGNIPEKEISASKIVYLIIPLDSIKDKQGFMENRTPSQKYRTEKEWRSEDGSLIIKRVNI